MKSSSALVGLGIILFLLGFSKGVSLATILIDTTPPTFVTYWGSTDKAAPLAIPDSWTTLDDIIFAYDTDGEGAKVNIYSATSTMYNGGTKIDGPLSLTYSSVLSSPPNYAWQGQFTISGYPKGVVLEARYLIADAAGNTATASGWWIYGGQPTADFYLNGIKLKSSDTVSIKVRTLSFKVVPTSLPDSVGSAKVNVAKGRFPDTTYLTTVTLTKQADGSYTGSYTASADGAYTLTAYIRTTSGSDTQLATIALDLGVDLVWPYTGTQTILMFAGVVCMVAGAKASKKR